MIFKIITLFPDFFKGFLENTIVSRALASGKVQINLINCRDFTKDKYKSCDDYTYGGGAGMILNPEPIAEALDYIHAKGKRIVFPTPSGNLYNQKLAYEYTKEKEIVILCGRYEGIDQRIIDLYKPDEISIGNYIVSGGEPAACVIMDSIIRLLPGVIKGESLKEESFSNGLLEYPQYTRPENFRGEKVPDILLSGHHKNIKNWRLKKSIEKTIIKRPDIIESVMADPGVSSDIKKTIKLIMEEELTDGFN